MVAGGCGMSAEPLTREDIEALDAECQIDLADGYITPHAQDIRLLAAAYFASESGRRAAEEQRDQAERDRDQARLEANAAEERAERLERERDAYLAALINIRTHRDPSIADTALAADDAARGEA